MLNIDASKSDQPRQPGLAGRGNGVETARTATQGHDQSAYACRRVVERSQPLPEGDYEAAVRMRHDVSLLPKPFQLSALTGRELHLDSPWRRFAVRAPEQSPAPVESREPVGAEQR